MTDASGSPGSAVRAEPPATLVSGLYVALAVLDLLLVPGSSSLLLAAAAVTAGAAVLALQHRGSARAAGWGTALVAAATLTGHAAATSNRPVTLALLLVAAASARAVALAVHECPPPPQAPPVPDDVTVAPEPAAVPALPEVDPDPRARLMRLAEALVEGAVVSLVEPDGQGALVISACTQPSLGGYSFAAESTSATERTYRSGRRLFIADPHLDPLVDPTHVERTDAASMLWEPVRMGDVTCAVLVVAWPQRLGEVPQTTIHAVSLLAEKAAGFLAEESLVNELAVFTSTDVLTGLHSRAEWDSRLADLMVTSTEREESLVVAVIDLDHFHTFNATHGQAAGDAHLARFARAARARLRHDGLIARWGGEEFSVALTAVTPEAAHSALERVRLAVPDGRTCSIGFAVWDHREPGGHLLDRAERGLHLAKDSGRNRTCQAT